jgi:hypothetical protein
MTFSHGEREGLETYDSKVPLSKAGNLHAGICEPVRKRLRVFHDFPIPQRSRIAGQPALAMETEITKGQDRTIAIGPTVEKAVRAELARLTIPSDESERSITIEVWRYDPCLLSKGTSVDRLSLYLSLEAAGDEHVEAALDDLLKGMTW